MTLYLLHSTPTNMTSDEATCQRKCNYHCTTDAPFIYKGPMANITYTTPSTDPTAPPTIRHATVPLDRIRPRPPTASTPDLDPQPTYLNLSDPDLNPQPTHPNPGDQTTRPLPPTAHPGTPSHGSLRGIRKALLDRWKHPHESKEQASVPHYRHSCPELTANPL